MHFTYVETESQRGQITCQSSHSELAELECEPRSDSGADTLNFSSVLGHYLDNRDYPLRLSIHSLCL